MKGVMQQAHESVMAELLLGPELPRRDVEGVSAWLEERGVGAEDRAALLADGVERLLLYRELVRETLRDAVLIAIPRSAARLGDQFEEYLALFLQERGARSHYLREVAREFLDFCEPRWHADARVAPYIPDLARHESLCIEVGSQATSGDRSGSALELERGVRFIEAARLVEYAYAVHQLSESEADRTPAAARRTWLLVYRSPEHEVRYLELTALAAGILKRLLNERCTLRAALEDACREAGVALDARVIEGAARVLSDLAERGALLGACDHPNQAGAS
jgi:hypothetical protein